MESNTRKSVLRRIERRGRTPHPDLFDHVLSADDKPPTNDAELVQLGSIALQAMLAGFGPMADWYYFTLFLIVNVPECYKILVDEIRTTFASYGDINIHNTANLHYLQACLDETLRMIANNSTGLPRYSPGAFVDGHYIPKGVRSHLLTDLSLPASLAYESYSRSLSKVACTHSAEVRDTSMTRCTFVQSGTYPRRIRYTIQYLPTTVSRDCRHSVSALARA